MNVIAETFPGVDVRLRPDGWAEVVAPRERLREIGQFLRDDPRLGLAYLSSLAGVDREGQGFEVVYHLLNLVRGTGVVLRVPLPREEPPRCPSVVDLWPTANWHEREAYDLLGIRFEGHPDLRRILLKEGWRGHPLRKDYQDTRAERRRQHQEEWVSGPPEVYRSTQWREDELPARNGGGAGPAPDADPEMR